MVLRKDVGKHASDCVARLVECEGCRSSIKHTDREVSGALVCLSLVRLNCCCRCTKLSALPEALPASSAPPNSPARISHLTMLPAPTM